MTSYHDRQSVMGIMERHEDAVSEIGVKELIENYWRCKLIKQQDLDPMDYVAVRFIHNRTKTVAWVEFRRRNVTSEDYCEIFMGMEKFQKLSVAASALFIPALFVVEFDDQFMWVDLTMIHPKTSYASRGNMANKRATDNERCVMIPVSKMKTLHIK